jgi:hypothetical protein
MNAKEVLKKLVQTLSKAVELTDATLADGTVLQSPTFDLGEKVDVVSADGTLSPAPDGEHEIALKDSEGKEVVIRVVTKDGIITERMNVEEAQAEVPEEEDMASIAGDDISSAETPDATTAEPQDIPQTMSEVYEKLSYRIEEMAARLAKLEEVKEDVISEEAPAKDEEMVPTEMKKAKALNKLNGAPIDDVKTTLSRQAQTSGKKAANSQEAFLSKLYK